MSHLSICVGGNVNFGGGECLRGSPIFSCLYENGGEVALRAFVRNIGIIMFFVAGARNYDSIRIFFKHFKSFWSFPCWSTH